MFILLGIGVLTFRRRLLIRNTFGGFVLGVGMGVALARRPVAGAKPLTNWICGAVFVALVIVPWALAFRSKGV